MVRTGVMRAYGGSLRANIRKSLSNRFLASLSGFSAALLLQSSTAVALLTTSFASASLIPVATGLAIMLGADVGTAIVAQLLSFNIKEIWPLLLLAGYILHSIFEKKNTKIKQVGRIFLGFAFILSGLNGLSTIAGSLQQNKLLVDILLTLSSDAMLAVFVAGIITYFVHSSLAIVLLVSGLASSNIISDQLVFLFVIGINIGGALPAVIMTLKEGIDARRIIIGNFLFRIFLGILCLIFYDQINAFIHFLFLEINGNKYFEFTIFVHVLFNIVLFITFINFLKPVSSALQTLFKDNNPQDNKLHLNYLKSSALEIPEIALNLASREVLRLVDKVQYLIQQSVNSLNYKSHSSIYQSKILKDDISESSLRVKNYLVKLSRLELSNSESNRIVETIKYANILENISRDIHKNIFDVIKEMHKDKKQFSALGRQELLGMFSYIETSFCLIVKVFMEGDEISAKDVVSREATYRNMENESRLSHVSRLSSADIQSQETSGFHLDILRDLNNINNSITSVAHTFLEVDEVEFAVNFSERR